MSSRTVIADARSLPVLADRLRKRIEMHNRRLAQPTRRPRLNMVSEARIRGELLVLKQTLASITAQLRRESA